MNSSFLKFKTVPSCIFKLFFVFISCATLSTCSLQSTEKQLDTYVEVLPTPEPVNRTVLLKRLTKIPNFDGGPARIVSMTARTGYLYVCTSVSGGLIWIVNEKTGFTEVWMNVTNALEMHNRKLHIGDKFHGGVRSIAFHPWNYKFYISIIEDRTKPLSAYEYLSRPNDEIIAKADSVLLEFTQNPGPYQWVPDLESLREVIRVGLVHIDHPIKELLFRRNLLYIGHGDGSVHSTLLGTGQNLNDALGKILRIDPLERNGLPYTVPSWNPFYGRPDVLPEIYAYGFRNPHTMCLSKKSPFDIFIGDAGRDNVEELNVLTSGENYGWPHREGPFVHLDYGGLYNGISPLPGDDAKYNYKYPSVALGHYGNAGWGFSQAKQAIATGCPIENDSDLDGWTFFTNFPSDGNLYFSLTHNIRYSAVTKGSPTDLRSASMYKAKIRFDHDDSSRFLVKAENMRDVIRYDLTQKSNKGRADTRIGRGTLGQMYISSKQSGIIYVATNSIGDPDFESKHPGLDTRKGALI